MFSQFGLIITYFRNTLTAHAITTLSISVQPRLYIPTFPPTQERQDMVTLATSILKRNSFNYIYITFTVDYHMSNVNTYEKIMQKYDLENSFVYLERFKKKQFIDEPYEPDIHRSRVIMSSISSLNGLPLNLSVNLAQRDEGNFKYGCQLVYLSTSVKIENVNDLKNSVIELKQFFSRGINSDELQSYAFRFAVFIKIKDNLSNEPLYIEVNTELFVVNFPFDRRVVTLNYPLESYYHDI